MKPPPGMRLLMLNDHGRPIGEKHAHAKLSDSDVDLVHELREGGMALAVIAEKFGVQKAAVWKIVHGINRCQVATRSSLVPERTKPRQRATAKKLAPPGSDPVESGPGLDLQRALNAWR